MLHALRCAAKPRKSRSIRSLPSVAPPSLPTKPCQNRSSAPTTEPLHPPPQPRFPSSIQTQPSIVPYILHDNSQPLMCRIAKVAFLTPAYPSCTAATGKAGLHAGQMLSFYPATALADCSQVCPSSCNRPVTRSLNRSISYRSISPSTISMLPMAATTSASNLPSHILGSVCRFAKQAARMWTRYGLAVPSLTM